MWFFFFCWLIWYFYGDFKPLIYIFLVFLGWSQQVKDFFFFFNKYFNVGSVWMLRSFAATSEGGLSWAHAFHVAPPVKECDKNFFWYVYYIHSSLPPLLIDISLPFGFGSYKNNYYNISWHWITNVKIYSFMFGMVIDLLNKTKLTNPLNLIYMKFM